MAQINAIIHQPVRLRIMASLMGLDTKEQVDFTYLRKLLKLTDGNLGAHLLKLEQAGYIRMEKTFIARKPRTFISPTKKGELAFEEHIQALLVNDLSEESGDKRLAVPRLPALRLRPNRPAVLHEYYSLRIEPPFDVALPEEIAGRDKLVHHGKLGLETTLAYEELRGLPLRETEVALRRRGLVAKGLRMGFDHQALVLADGDVLVKRRNYADIRQQSLGVGEQVDAEMYVVLEMNDIRLHCLQQVSECVVYLRKIE